MPWCPRSIVAHCIIIAVTSEVGICVDGDGFMSMEEGPTMAYPTLLHSPQFPSSSETLLRKGSVPEDEGN